METCASLLTEFRTSDIITYVAVAKSSELMRLKKLRWHGLKEITKQ